VEGALNESLGKLGLEYVDFYLVHWPVAYEEVGEGVTKRAKIPNHETWADMEAMQNSGKTKAIGVSNYNV
jgi:diketogulonate reductase-like aldo/keto reductase